SPINPRGGYWSPESEVPPTVPPVVLPPYNVSEWALNVRYIINNFVLYNNNLYYRCVRPHISTAENAPTAPSGIVYWIPVQLSGIPPPGLPPVGLEPWKVYTTYAAGFSRVTFHGSTYRAIVSHISTRFNSPANP